MTAACFAPRAVTRLLPAALALVVAGCDASNPVAPADPQQEGVPATSYSLSIAVTPAQVFAGGTATITVTVTPNRTSSAPEDGTELTVSTDLGTFDGDLRCSSPQLCSVAIRSGTATVEFVPGDEAGMAEILASLGDSVGRLPLAILDPGDPPVADFMFEVIGLQAAFTDASAGSPSAWRWDFGDGTACPGFETACSAACCRQNPVHEYAAAAVYVVNLAVQNAIGQSSSVNKLVPAPPDLMPLEAAFAFEVNGLRVIFSDISEGEPTNRTWDFGDGTSDSSNNPNPVHDYGETSGAGTYVVTLTVENASGETDSTSQFVTVEPGGLRADFDFAIDAVDPLKALFTNTSAGDPVSFFWDFDDPDPGNTNSSAESPTHKYPAADCYCVRLTVEDAAGGTSFTDKEVAVSAVCDDDFECPAP